CGECGWRYTRRSSRQDVAFFDGQSSLPSFRASLLSICPALCLPRFSSALLSAFPASRRPALCLPASRLPCSLPSCFSSALLSAFPASRLPALCLPCFLVCPALRLSHHALHPSTPIHTTNDPTFQVAEETVSLVRVVRTFGTESEEVKRYDEPLRRLVEVGLRRSVANGLWTCADNIVYNTSMVAVVIMAGGALTTGRISAEQVTQFVMYADWMAYNMWCAGGHWATLMDSIGACHRVFQLLDLPHPEQLNQGHGECACTDWMAYNMWCAGGHWATLMDSIGACHRVFQLLDLPHPEQLATQGRGECECTGIGVRSMACAGDHWATLMDSIGACHQVFQLLDLPNPKHVTQGHDECACVHGSQGRVLPSLSGKLEFRDLSFRYPTRPEALVLEGISLTIQPGELVALVGHNGSGKSTLLRLLQRLYEPTEGQVLIDDVPLPEVDIAWLRSHIGVVSQEPLLFSRDVASNIAYGSSKELSRQDIVQAATQANAHQFISELPEGYDTVVDNARLSGGQKQRIAIARALVRDPTLLFLDEATSALDAESEHYVQMALNQVIHDDSHASGGRRQTRVVIAHRLSTIRSADRIVVVSHGKIIEVGTHEQLMERKGAYMELHSKRNEAPASH
ncbi:unnamed protein product, partial [Closterium sp. NIES-65]